MGKLDFHTLAQIHNIPFEEAELIHLQPGNRVGPHNRYEIVDLLGIGSVGVVYLVKDFDMGKSLYALKMILPYMLQDDEKQLNMFIDYLSIIQDMEHPNVVRIKDFWKQNTLYFYTMEYIEGVSLRQWLKSHHAHSQYLTLTEMCDLALQICQGLAFLHQHSGHFVLHPDNIMLAAAPANQVKVCDFGIYYLQPNHFWKELAAFADRQMYQAPEIRKLDAKPTIQADLFSLAAIFYEMLVNFFPVSPVRRLSHLRQDIPPQLDQLLLQCLEQDPQERPRDMQDVIRVLQNSLDGLSTRVVKVVFAPTAVAVSELPAVPDNKASSDSGQLPEIARAASHAVPMEAPLPATTRPPEQETAAVQPSVTTEADKTAASDTSEEKLEVGFDSSLIVLQQMGEELKAKLNNQPVEGDRSASPEERLLVVAEALRLAGEKRWPQAIDVWKKAMSLSADAKLEEMVRQAQEKLDKAGELKKQAQQAADLYVVRDLCGKSIELYPFDAEAEKLYCESNDKISQLEAGANDVLSQGDRLVEEKKYTEAVQAWEKGLGATPHKDKEIHDRIMQVVDMKAEQAKNLLEKGKPYEAADLLKQVSGYSADPMIKELKSEVEQEIRERERRFEDALREGEKHMEKKQLTAAIEVWQRALGLDDKKEELLLRKIQTAKELHEKIGKDEEEYLKLSSLVRNLEQHEDYQAALQTLEKMRQRRGGWACPTANLAAEVERMTKLAAAANSSKEASKILTEASDALKQGKLSKVANLLNYPVFKRALTPVVTEKYHDLLERLEKQKTRKKLMVRLACVGGALVTLAAVAIYLLWLR